MRLVACRVPWIVSPSMSGLIVRYTEDDSGPGCQASFGGGRLVDGKIDNRRIEVSFHDAWEIRVAPLSGGEHSKHIPGFEPEPVSTTLENYVEWLNEWEVTGICPDPGFYRDPTAGRYFITGDDAYAEIHARRYSWREWQWTSGQRELLTDLSLVIGSGEGA